VRESADQRAERILQEVSKPEVAIKERQQETAEQAEARALRRLNEYDLPELERQKLETRIRQQTEQRQRDELEQIQLAEEKRKQEAYTRGKGPMSEVEVAEAAQRLGRSPAAINAMTRAEVQAELAKAGEVPEEVRTSRAIEAERALHPVPPSLTDPDEIAAWKRANETPTEALIRRRKELEVESTVRAGPEATDFINKQSEAHASLRQLEQDAALRAKHSEALGQGIISGSAFAQVGLEGEKILKSIWPNMDLAKIEPTQAVAALAALRLQAKAKTSNLGAGQGFTGKDAEIVADAIGGNKVMTPEAVRRILTLEAQIDRFRQEQINEDIKQRRLANPNMASRSIVKPIGLEPINDDMRRFASNDALTAAVKSKDGYDNTAKTMGKTTTKELTDDMEKTIQAKLTKMNDKNKLRDVADTESFNTYKNMSLRGLERNRDKIVQGWTGPDNNLDDRDASLMTLMIEAKRAGKFGKIE